MSIEVAPDGKVVNFNVDETPLLNYVNGFMIDPSEGGRVLFIQKNRPEFQKGKWNGIGGKVEFGERPINAMVREFQEETGVVTAPEDWTFCIHLVQPRYHVRFYRCFVDKFPAYKTVTDEVVRVWNIDDVYGAGKFERIPTLANMKWILAMLANQQIAWPLTIHLQAGNS